MNSLVVSVMNFLLIVGGIAFVWILLAVLVGDFADRKGHRGRFWFGLSLISSPLIGFVVVALLPSSADLTPVEYTWCRYCLRTVRVRTDICPYCHADLTRKKTAEKKAA
jgi:MFS family permease